MSTLAVVSVTPGPGTTDVVLGLPIVVNFNALINTTTFNAGSFALTCPGGTQIVTPDNLIGSFPKTTQNLQNIPGVFSFTVDGDTGFSIATFTPSVPLQPNTVYSVIVIGGTSLLSSANAVSDVGGNVLKSSYNWSFTTGVIDVTTPPNASPLPGPITTYIDPATIVIVPRGDLLNQPLAIGYSVEIIFPNPIVQDSLDLSDIQICLEPMLNDPTIRIPSGLAAQVIFDPDNANGLIVSIVASS
jgi:hypothetical protein